jgi:hypothetical protein
VLSLLYANAVFAQPAFKTGDIIFQSSQGKTNLAIELATHSKFSHVGIIVKQNQQDFVLEASEPLSLTPLATFIERGTNAYYEVLRLKNAKKINQQKTKHLWAMAKNWLGRSYDAVFSWTDEQFYCSELVYKLYERVLNQRLATPKPLKSFDLSHPLVQEQLTVKYGDKIPLEENMISPQQLYESKLLVKIAP